LTHVSFTDAANERVLTSAELLLGELQWDVEPDPYQRLKVSSGTPVDALLPLMARRALDPNVIGLLLDALPTRPLERALVAWDVLKTSLLGRGNGELTQRLAREIAPLKQFGPPASVAIPRARVSALIDHVRPPSTDKALFQDFATVPSLAALVQLTEVRKDLHDSPELVEAVVAHAKRLALAHLPSLALGFLQVRASFPNVAIEEDVGACGGSFPSQGGADSAPVARGQVRGAIRKCGERSRSSSLAQEPSTARWTND